MDSELPKRLFEEGAEPLGDKINKCARISILKVLANNIKSEYDEVKRDPLFAHIFAIYENRLHFSAKLVHSVLTRQLITAKKHELWLLKTHGLISLETIRKKHIFEANTWTRVDRLRLVYVCVAALLMAVDEKSWVSHDYIKVIMDFDKLRAYPWGRRSFDHLVDAIIKARTELSKPISYVLEGFAYALQIWIMEAIPDCGTMLGKKLNAVGHIFPRCSNWTGAARASFGDIIELENALVNKGHLYSYISSTGNMDVILDQDFVRNDEMRDERVDRIHKLISENHNWSSRTWEFEEPVNPTPAAVPTAATESEVVHNEGVKPGEVLGEATGSSGSRTGKRKVVDKGAEARKKRLLFERSVANAEEGSERYMRGLFDEYEKRMTKQSDERYEKLATEFSQLQSTVSELKNMLADALSRGNSGEPSSRTKPVSPVSSKPKGKVNSTKNPNN
ncbi:unnamed protein product [Microthlaspi erraticum]|uniref:DUF1985 domain-containing protein n=1 Tax=Microthlaspi erraticum TaxID=1685480 RepID=A0A6D2IZ23_9BRAS|nr:unnamed protein product [Microthlaspi erraticum]